MVAQVANEMAYVYSEGVAHFDLKSANILVNLTNPRFPRCKFADFGLAMGQPRPF